MPYGVTEEAYERIEKLIASDDSPVGIDAKVTHIIILHKLDRIARRLERLEHRLEGSSVEER